MVYERRTEAGIEQLVVPDWIKELIDRRLSYLRKHGRAVWFQNGQNSSDVKKVCVEALALDSDELEKIWIEKAFDCDYFSFLNQHDLWLTYFMEELASSKPMILGDV